MRAASRAGSDEAGGDWAAAVDRDPGPAQVVGEVGAGGGDQLVVEPGGGVLGAVVALARPSFSAGCPAFAAAFPAPDIPR